MTAEVNHSCNICNGFKYVLPIGFYRCVIWLCFDHILDQINFLLPVFSRCFPNTKAIFIWSSFTYYFGEFCNCVNPLTLMLVMPYINVDFSWNICIFDNMCITIHVLFIFSWLLNYERSKCKAKVMSIMSETEISLYFLIPKNVRGFVSHIHVQIPFSSFVCLHSISINNSSNNMRCPHQDLDK